MTWNMDQKPEAKQGVETFLPGGLLEDLRKMIQGAREGIARTVCRRALQNVPGSGHFKVYHPNG